MIAIGSDHAGFDKKQIVKKYLDEHHIAYEDMGTYSNDSVDYPDYAAKVAGAVSIGKMPEGILLCGSGNGVCISANKFRHIRAGLAFNSEVAILVRKHNNANIICFPARFISDEELVKSLDNWFNTKFEGGRHERRVEKINELENKNL